MALDPKDCEITTFWTWGFKPSHTVRITYLPTGQSATVTSEHTFRAKRECMKLLEELVKNV